MESKNNGKRALLSERNTALALGVVKELKQKDCKLNLSELVNEILEIFFSKHYEKSKNRLEKRFFDRKKYLQNLILSEKGEDLDESLQKYVKTLNRTKKGEKQ